MAVAKTSTHWPSSGYGSLTTPRLVFLATHFGNVTKISGRCVSSQMLLTRCLGYISDWLRNCGLFAFDPAIN